MISSQESDEFPPQKEKPKKSGRKKKIGWKKKSVVKNENLGLEKLSSACDNFHGFGNFSSSVCVNILCVRKKIKLLLEKQRFFNEMLCKA